MSASTSAEKLAPAAPRSLLRVALRLDALVTGANGAAYLVAAAPIGDLLGLPPALLRGAGLFLLAFAAAVWLAGARPAPRPAAARAVALANVLWSAGSIVAALGGWGSPTTEGTVWIALQAVVVGGFAELQLVALKRDR